MKETKGNSMANKLIKSCEFCGRDFETDDSKHGQRKRFCNTSCSAKWRNKTFGPNQLSEETKRKNAERLKARWKDPTFRANNHKRMTENNPVYMDGVVQKANNTKLKNGYCKNNFIYGNGRISKYELIAMEYLKDFDFVYNKAISTKLARDKLPFNKYPTSYKPDFTNDTLKICIEIDGPNHTHTKELDAKKDECLAFLGYTVYRFTHEQIDNGEFYKEVDKLWDDLYENNYLKK